MNPIVVIIAVLFCILMVAFGNNPIEEAKEEYAKKMEGKDPLIHAIEEHNKATQFQDFGVGDALNTVPGSQRTYTYSPNNTGYQDPTGAPPNYPGYMMRDGQPQNYQQPQLVPSQPAQQPQNNYYPPPPTSGPASPLQPQQQPRSQFKTPDIWLPTFSSMRELPVLSTGQRLHFVGMNVYTFDRNGIPMVMPNGRYAMYNGAVTLIVKDGKKIIID